MMPFDSLCEVEAKVAMPTQTYKNRAEISPDISLWHYSSIDAIAAILRSHSLRLSRVDTFRDPFEGSVPKQQMEDETLLFLSAHARQRQYNSLRGHYPQMRGVDADPFRDLWADMTHRRRALVASSHAICWAAGDESEALWRLYCNHTERSGQGVALRTTLLKLESAVAGNDLIISPVRYRPYHEGPAFSDHLDALFHKRRGFRAESELRVLRYDELQYQSLMETLRDPQAPVPPALEPYFFLNWATHNAVDAIVISPYASDTYEQEARSAIASVDRAFHSLIELSELSERRYAPNF